MFDLIAYYNRMQDHYGAFDHQNRPRDLAPDRHVERLVRRGAVVTLTRGSRLA